MGLRRDQPNIVVVSSSSIDDLALCPSCGYRVGQLEQLEAENERLRTTVAELVAFVKAVGDEANNTDLDVRKMLRRLRLDA